MGELNGDVAGIAALVSFMSLMVALFSEIPSGMWYYPGFPIFLGRDSSNGFLLAFPITIALTPQGMEPRREFCQVLSMSLQLCILELGSGWGGNHRMGSETHCEMNLS